MERSTDEKIRALTEAAAQGDGGAIEALPVRYLPGLRAFVRSSNASSPRSIHLHRALTRLARILGEESIR